MFLFTTPTGTPAAGSATSPVLDAIRQGAEQTGTSFDYLLSTAKRESALDPKAKAGTSSASGLFQFVEQTWLGLVKSEGSKLGLSDLSDAISARPDGGFAVADGATRDAILKLREDPRLASILAGTLTQQNRGALSAATGREPNPGELYMAHLLGAQGATNVIRAANDNPERAVALDMPDAAAANRNIFFDRRGRARGAGELYAVLGAAANAAGTTAAAPAQEVAAATPLQPTGNGLRGLFTTGGRAGPISDAVAKLWRVNNVHVGTQTASVGFFPRDDDAIREATASDATPILKAAPSPAPSAEPAEPSANVPLPPPRPSARADAPPPSGATTKRGGRRS